jgi:hypothetical protein
MLKWIPLDMWMKMRHPCVSLEHVHDSPNVFCALSKERVYGPFFTETTITGTVYLDMFKHFLIPQLDENDQEGRVHFQQDGAPPHYLGEMHEYLNIRFPGRWTGRSASIAWPPRSPDHPWIVSYGDSLMIE